MTDETLDVPNTAKRMAAEGYNIGFANGPQPDAPSYWELNNDLLREAFVRLNTVQENSIGKNRYSENSSFRQGTLVYYDPRDRGPYTDGQDALADVPDGGTLHLAAADYDVPTEGPLHRLTSITIEGEGWFSYGAFPPSEGTRLINEGADAIDKPVIKFEKGPNNRYENAVIKHLCIRQAAPNSAGIVVNDHPRSKIKNVLATGIDKSPIGINLVGQSWASIIEDCMVANFDDAQYRIHTAGSHTALRGCYTFSGSASSAGIKVIDNQILIYGGEDRVHGGPGVEFVNNDTSQSKIGGVVFGRLFEDCDPAIQVGGPGRYRNLDIMYPEGTIGTDHSNNKRLIRFQNAEDCRLWYPQIWQLDEEQAIEFGPDAEHCGVIHDGGRMVNAGISADAGATGCYQIIQSAIESSVLPDVATGPNLYTAVSYAVGIGPVWHDGQQWHKPQSQTFTP